MLLHQPIATLNKVINVKGNVFYNDRKKSIIKTKDNAIKGFRACKAAEPNGIFLAGGR
jgi:hypothetical protein